MITKLFSDHPSISLFSLAVAVLTISFSGCSTLSTKGGDRAMPTMAAESEGSYRVELEGNFGKKSVYTGQLTKPTTVQMALEESGAIQKLRNLDVWILRVVAESGQPLKMDVRFDPAKKVIAPEQDYAILPNDRIVVKPKSDNMLDKMLESVGGK